MRNDKISNLVNWFTNRGGITIEGTNPGVVVFVWEHGEEKSVGTEFSGLDVVEVLERAYKKVAPEPFFELQEDGYVRDEFGEARGETAIDFMCDLICDLGYDALDAKAVAEAVFDFPGGKINAKELLS